MKIIKEETCFFNLIFYVEIFFFDETSMIDLFFKLFFFTFQHIFAYTYTEWVSERASE